MFKYSSVSSNFLKVIYSFLVLILCLFPFTRCIYNHHLGHCVISWMVMKFYDPTISSWCCTNCAIFLYRGKHKSWHEDSFRIIEHCIKRNFPSLEYRLIRVVGKKNNFWFFVIDTPFLMVFSKKNYFFRSVSIYP